MKIGVFLNKIAKLVAGLYAVLFYRRKLEVEPCDILILHNKAGAIRRADRLIKELEKNNFKVHHEVYPPIKKIIMGRLLVKTERIAPFAYCLFEYWAAYLVNKYRPRILITFINESVLPVFFKAEMEKTGGKLINIAHGTMLYQEHGTFDFHYYFRFGQYSVDKACRQKTRYGSTKIVKAGSFYIEEDFSLPVNREFKKVLFFSTWLPEEVKEIHLRDFNLLAEWAKVQQKYHLVIKHHPSEDKSVIKSIFKDITNVTFLPIKIGMKDALRDISLVMISWSSASLEAALLNRPAVVILDSDILPDHELEKYYLPRARTVEDIQDRIDETFARYDHFLEGARKYVKRHLEHTTDSIPFMAKCIKSIYDGEEDFEYIEIEGTKNRY